MNSPVEEIKSRVDVVDLVNSYVRLQKAGINFRACCPFHNEKTPSFFVTPARQIWHCFGCGKGGDIFAFLMSIEGYDFPEALKVLGDRAGVEVHREDPKLRSERVRLVALLDEAALFFEQQLAQNESARAYLKNRGLQDEIVSEFRIGYAPDDWHALGAHLKTKEFTDSEIEKAGLAIKSQPTNYYDRFRGRIMFPIADYSGRVVGFGGRIFLPTPEGVGTPTSQNASVGAKYINSPETPLYQKSKILYGLHKAKSEILRSETCIVVEGYMDMLMAYQAGTKNVVASSGTAFTYDQVRTLKRLANTFIAAFDMDAAGQSAARRGIDLALAQNFTVRVARLGEYKDPADAVAKDPAIWTHAVDHASHIVQFYLDSVQGKHALRTPEFSRAVQKEVLPVVAALTSDLERAHWSLEISKILGIKEEIIWEAQKSLKSPGSGVEASIVEPETASIRVRSRKELLEDRVLGLSAKYPQFLERDAEHPVEQFFSGEKKIVLDHIRRGADTTAKVAGLPLQDFVSRLILEAELSLENASAVSQLAEADVSVDTAGAEAEFIRCARELERENLRERLQELSSHIALAEKKNDQTLPTLLIEFNTVSKKLSHT